MGDSEGGLFRYRKRVILLKDPHVLANAATVLRKSLIYVAAFARTWSRIPKRLLFQQNHESNMTLKFTRIFRLATLLAALASGEIAEGKIALGIDVLEEKHFEILRGKRVGLLTHPAGVNRYGTSTIDVLRHHKRVNLVALFGPEHGIYGDEKANQRIAHGRDRRTGLPVYSLYGKHRNPSPEMLAGIDVLVIDLQDVGVRAYTYVSAMRLSLEACFEAGIHVVVLDRPNPLGGLKVDGPLLEKRWKSYVGPFPTPYIHGLTIGELAGMAHNVPGWLDVDERTRNRGRLTVVPMRGWRRRMMWPSTGLRWIPTSPAITDLSAALGFAMTGLGCQLGGFSHGYGPSYLFRIIRYPGKTPEQIRDALAAKVLPGLGLRIIKFHQADGSEARGLYVAVSDWARVRPTEISFYLMQIASQWNRRNPFAAATEKEAILFNKHVGSTAWWQAISSQGADVNVGAFIDRWQKQSRVFQAISRKYWLYF